MSLQPSRPVFLVTGCGRSGTGWASALFTALGYPCGHEKLFNPWQAGPLAQPESSWLAIPHLRELPAETPILRIMRDPYLVVQSAIERGFLANMEDMYDLYVQKYRPDIAQAESHLGRVIRWVSLWDEPLTTTSHVVLRTGLPDVDSVSYATGVNLSAEFIATTTQTLGSKVNTNLAPWTTRPSRDRIDAHPDAQLLRTRSEEFGYGLYNPDKV